MEVVTLYWWRHNNKIGQYSASKVHDSVKISPKEGISVPRALEDYDISLEEFADLKPEIIPGI